VSGVLDLLLTILPMDLTVLYTLERGAYSN